MDFSRSRNRLADKDSLFRLANSISDADLGLQISLVKLQAMLGTDPFPDELIAAAGQALATLRAACTKLEVFLFTLDRL